MKFYADRPPFTEHRSIMFRLTGLSVLTINWLGMRAWAGAGYHYERQAYNHGLTFTARLGPVVIGLKWPTKKQAEYARNYRGKA